MQLVLPFEALCRLAEESATITARSPGSSGLVQLRRGPASGRGREACFLDIFRLAGSCTNSRSLSRRLVSCEDEASAVVRTGGPSCAAGGSASPAALNPDPPLPDEPAPSAPEPPPRERNAPLEASEEGGGDGGLIFRGAPPHGVKPASDGLGWSPSLGTTPGAETSAQVRDRASPGPDA
jgi:hypothetical protein